MAANATPTNHEGNIARNSAGTAKIGSVLLQKRRVFDRFVDTRGDGHVAEQRDQGQQERIGRQKRGIAGDGEPVARAQNAGHRVRVEKQRQGRAKGESGVSAVIAKSGALRRGEQQFGGRHGREDFAIAAELDRDHGDRDDDGDPDQDILDDRDRRRRPEPSYR
jgi:hypothetical protein